MGCLKNVNFIKDGGIFRGVLPLPEGIAASDSKSENLYVFPGFADVHVHLREPGFSYKETIFSGTLAAARGGYTDLCSMPNVEPPPDGLEGLNAQLELIKRGAAVRVTPVGCITRRRGGKELSDMEALAPYVPGFSDDGSGLESDELMRQAMGKAKSLGKLIIAHCEDMSAPLAEREWRQLRRDLDLVRETGCAYHVCHVSKKESVALIRKAKAEGLDVTCETAPHHLLLDETMIRDDGRFKMNPPIGTSEDRRALIEALEDRTIDMIATDHAPHSPEEKSGGFAKSANGVVGLDCAFPVLYTALVKTGVITLLRLVELMSAAPRKRFGLTGGEDDYSLWDLGARYKIDPDEFKSLGRATPFEGMEVHARCLMTVTDGNVIWPASQ